MSDDGFGNEDSLESPRLQFYLRNQDLILQWAALKNEVREATSDLLLGLRDDLELRAAELGDDVVVRADGIGGRWPRLVLMRSGWPVEQGQALVGATLEWTPKVNPGGSERPYHGIRVDRNVPTGATISAALRPVVKDSGLFAPDYTMTGWWTALRYIERDDAWWKDIPGWRLRVIEAFLTSWRLGAPLIERVLHDLGAQPDGQP